MTWILGVLGLQAAQAMPLASYDEHLAKGQRERLDVVIESSCHFSPSERAMVCDDRLQEAIRLAERFDLDVLQDAELRYLMGLASRYLGEETSARRRFERSLMLDPNHIAASYDLGELLLISGELPAARDCFQRVADHNQDPSTQWLGPWRLAEVSAMQGDAERFEAHLKQAIRKGFSLRQIEGLPNWIAFYQDPDLQDVIQKMIALYGTQETLESLQPTQTKAAP